MRNHGWWCGAIALALVGCVDLDVETETSEASQESQVNGKQLFERETFGGNGRTCATCHGDQTGTVSPAEAQRLFERAPNAPLFRSIDSDDGVGSSYTRLLTDATILVTLDLPANWSLADDPTARTITLPRAIPSTLNVPSLDSLFMADGRFDNLQEQAHGAINSHYEPGRQPTGAELDAISEHQQTTRFFSNNALKHYANGGPAPTLPEGNTAAEKRGRLWYVTSAAGVCSHCHDGPMLNATNQFLLAPLPPGSRFFTAFVSELNKAGSPIRTFNVANPDGSTTVVQSTDPGRALITGNPGEANFFRIPTLWGSANTGPWFHDNSAKTLPDLAQHYSDYFQIVGLPALTAQEQSDIIAYLKLL
ncbi:MAG: cytochrome c peroxidase [Kofleriaceae bacterium]